MDDEFQLSIRHMELPKVRPIHVVNQEGISDLEKTAILESALEFGELTGLDVHEDKNFQNIGLYVQRGKELSSRRKQINAGAVLGYLVGKAFQSRQKGENPPYILLVLAHDIYSGNSQFITGLSEEGIGGVISTMRFSELKNDELRSESIKKAAMHVVSHIFGLPSAQRTKNIVYDSGRHCTNACVMQNAVNIPSDWAKMVKYNVGLCKPCQQDLRDYFSQQ